MSIIELAITKGTDPDSLAKLVDLQERVRKSEAEKAFNLAFSAFQDECPAVGHDAEGYKSEYSYASLPQIVAVIKPYLAKHRLSYSFDSRVDGQSITVICTIRHVDGHCLPAQYTAPVDGTKMMNALQKAASAITYGKRHALCEALGIVTADSDDDGRSATPRPRPDARSDAPQQAPRDNRVTKEEMANLFNEWQRQLGEGVPETERRAKFFVWANKATDGAIAVADADQMKKWTRELWSICMDRLEVPF
ncbi:ERF family protein [Planctomyces sp. SH-PL14]|uniref:ERF family protein n=1 Tax=Planctomyces sp. SH-PL14 TaxID=1632864 RepID=UPI0018D427E8|nr:ERF family protein [Planctomyces sp. SH-PL14]